MSRVLVRLDHSSSERTSSDVSGYATASGKTPSWPERNATQSPKLWPRAWRSRSSASNERNDAVPTRLAGTVLSTSSRLAIFVGVGGPTQSLRAPRLFAGTS